MVPRGVVTLLSGTGLSDVLSDLTTIRRRSLVYSPFSIGCSSLAHWHHSLGLARNIGRIVVISP